MIVTDISRLRVKCASTTLKQCEEMGLFRELEQELKASKISGIGLAAPQIGHYLRACIIRIPEHTDPEGRHRHEVCLNMLNPIIEEGLEPIEVQGERCLSLPGVQVDTLRFKQVTVTWLDYDTKAQRKGFFYGMESTCVQHECQHLEGELIIDHKIQRQEKVGRNDPCPCGSGRKFKKCCISKQP